MLTTGTGASGEMRDTLPHRNSSSMRSPSTRIRLAEKPARIRRRLSSDNCIVREQCSNTRFRVPAQFFCARRYVAGGLRVRAHEYNTNRRGFAGPVIPLLRHMHKPTCAGITLGVALLLLAFRPPALRAAVIPAPTSAA